MTKSLVALVTSLFLFSAAFSQSDFSSEEELKEKAQELFEQRKLVEASPLYAQLLSLYPQDPNFNYKYAATLLEASADREKPLKYLKFAISKSSQVEPLAYYFLGKAHHLNYNFADAVKFYSRFKQKGDGDLQEEFMVDRQIEMAKNGNQLLSKLNEVQVLDKQEISRKDFFRIYELEGINGKIIVKPEEFKTKYDQKIEESSVIYLPNNATEVYFSSYGKKGENGRDIFKTVKLGNRNWSEPVNLGPSINTPYDENYPFIHPDGRTLYFASKGHSSMGGYDLFMSVYDEATAQWKAPVNLDFAFSSVDDDILFVTDKDKVLAYFASNRANEADNITVYKVMVEKAPADLSVIKGKFIAENDPNLKRAKITVVDVATQQTVGIYETDKDGNYQVEIASNGGKYRFNLETTDEAPIHTGEVDIPRQDEFEVLGQELRLVGKGDDQTLVIKNIFDGSVADASSSAGPKVSSTTLRRKALLDVNFSKEALAELERRNSQQETSAAGEAQASSNEAIAAETQSVESSESQAATETKEIDEGTAADENETGGSSDDIASLRNSYQDLADAVGQKEQKMGLQTEIAFNQAASLKDQAQEAFAALGVDPKTDQAETLNELESDNINEAGGSSTELNEKVSSASEDKVDPELLKARELASKAAIRAAIAQKMKIRSDQLSDLNQKVSKGEAELTTKDQEPTNTDLIDLSNQLEENKNDFQAVEDNETYLENYRANVDQLIQESDQELKNDQAKLSGLLKENSRLDSSISEIEASVSGEEPMSASDSSALAALKLDKSDIRFQINNARSSIKKKKNELAALNLEKDELSAISSEIANLDQTDAESMTKMTVAEKEELISELKVYRNNNQLAYYDASQEEAAEELALPSSDRLASSTAIAASTSGQAPLAALKDTEALNAEYQSKLEASASIGDADMRLAREEEVYRDWVKELEEQRDLRNQQLRSDQLTENERTQLSDQINQLTTERSRRNQELSKLSEQLAQLSGGQDQIAENTKSDTAPSTSAEDDSSVSSQTDQTESEGIESEASDQSATNEEISSGNSAADALAAEIENIPLDQIEASSPYPTGLNTFNFDKNYNYNSSGSQLPLTSVKKSLYQAKELSSQADAARAAAYTLPTVEERRNAFDDVNNYEEASRMKQIQAMRDLSTVNQQEFFRNTSILNNLNNYDNSEVESTNLDIALLLQDEADVYFQNAQSLRTEINQSVSSMDSKEIKVKLQKAYDLEMLALNKQRQALESLKLVSDELAEKPAEGESESRNYQNAQIQTITDPEVLAIEDAEEAKKEADALVQTAKKLEDKAIQIKKSAEVLDIGPERDSLLAVYESKQDSAVQLRNKASVYYEREEQIKTGFEGEPIDAGILKPALVFTQSYDIDTVNLNEEREATVLESKEYQQFLSAAKDNKKMIRAAEVEYEKAVELRKRQIELDRKAQVMLKSAADVDDPSEKERRIKQAQVIELKAEKIDDSIDSLNKIIRVKNYLVRTSEEKMKGTISALRATQQAEIIYLANREIGVEKVSEDQLAALESSAQSDSESTTKTDGAVRPTSNQRGGTAEKGDQAGLTEENESAAESSSATEEDIQAAELSSEEEITADKAEQSEASSADDIVSSEEVPLGSTEQIAETPSKDKSSSADEEEILRDGTVNPNKIIRSTPSRPIKLEEIDRVPKRVEEPIFIKLGLNESAYDAENPIPKMTELPDGIIYKVQVGAFRKPIPQDLFKGFAPLTAEEGPNGITRYTAGLFNKERIAVAARDEIRAFGYKDAFVVAFKNGERISIRAARTTDDGEIVVEEESVASASQSERIPESTEDFGEGIRDIKTINRLYFTVQIGVYSKAVESGTFAQFKNVNAIKLPSGLIRYNSGIFENMESAAQYQKVVENDIADAFVVAYYRGKRISIDEAARILNQNQ